MVSAGKEMTMEDAEYIFNQTSAERKRVGRGDYYKKRKGGRYVRLPSDNLTEKEKRALNGKCVTYNLNRPASWKGFKTWPQDVQIEYLKKLDDMGATTYDMAKMFGCGYSTLARHRRLLGCACSVGGKHKGIDKSAWLKFIGDAVPVAPPEVLTASEETVEIPEKKEEPQEKKEDTGAIKVDNSSIMNIAILLDALKGSGAKLTIEVVL